MNNDIPEIPFNADDADLVNGCPSLTWLHANHPLAIHQQCYDDMLHTSQKEFIISVIEEARRKGYWIIGVNPSDSWVNPALIDRDRDKYGVLISRNATWICHGEVGTTELAYHYVWPKSQGIIKDINPWKSSD